MNRVVYDSVNESKILPKLSEDKAQTQQEARDIDQAIQQEINNPLNLPTPTNCDNILDNEPYYKKSGDNDYTLCFESRIESGNLRRAIQVYEFEYDLILKPDTNTKSHNQWFYFMFSNTKKGKKYRFNIINLLKPDSLYNHGMMPLMYSDIEAKTTGVGWQRAGKNVCYY